MRQFAPALLSLTLFLGACGGEKEAAMDSASSTAVSGMMDSSSNMTSNMSSTMPMTMMLASMNNSGATADVALSAVGEQSSVAVNLMGAAANAVLKAHVHSGTCEAQGPVVAPLDSLMTDASGHATTSTMLDLPMNTLANGQHYIQVHAPDGQPTACGNVSMHNK